MDRSSSAAASSVAVAAAAVASTATATATVTATDRVLFRLRFKLLAEITVSLPFFCLLFCFCTAMLFQYQEVNRTFCNVYNVIPSISAITGIAPQCYIWRVGMALHCTPRLFIASIYYNNYALRSHFLPPTQRNKYRRWSSVNYWLNVLENSALIGVTYISNRDNYPIHEKLFITFMVSSIAYMLLNNVIFRWSRPRMTPLERRSYGLKLGLFALTCGSTLGLLYYFYRHRRFCEELAFSYFAFCEYCIAVANMAYHVTVMWDFGDVLITVGLPKLHSTANKRD